MKVSLLRRSVLVSAIGSMLALIQADAGPQRKRAHRRPWWYG